jgi:transketolase N-terminal domain/subunit
MAAPTILAELVQRFERNRASYQASGYNETQLRREFLDPFFKALGWDIDNEQGHAEAYKDVIHEDASRSAAPPRRPTTAFASAAGGFSFWKPKSRRSICATT